MFYKNKTQGVLAKNNKKNKKNKKTKCPYCLQETPNTTLLYTLRQISKNETGEINKKKIGVEKSRKYYKIETEEI
jgi:hypothetical protein